MKHLSIIIKNFLMILKNKSYIFVIISLPALLVITTSFTIGSVSIHNVPVGLSGEREHVQEVASILWMEGFKKTIYLDEEECIKKVKENKIGVCVNLSENRVEIIFDNTRPETSGRIFYFFEGFFLRKKDAVSEEMMKKTEENLVVFLSFVNDFSENVDESKKDLLETREELVKTRGNLVKIKNDYREFEKIVGDFEVSLKKMENIYLFLDENKDEIISVMDEETGDVFISVLEEMKNFNSDTKDFSNWSKGISEKIEETDKKLLDGIEKIDKILILLEDSKKEISKIKSGFDEIPENIGIVLSGKGVFEDKGEKRYTDLIFPKIATLIIIFITLYVSTIFTLVLVKSKGYIREMMTPTRNASFLFSSFIVLSFMGLFFASIVFFVGYFYPGVEPSNYLFLSIFIILIIFLFTEIGMLFGYSIKSENIAVSCVTFFIVFLIILSDLIIPIFFFPTITHHIIKLNPLNISENSISQIMLSPASWWILEKNFYVMLGMIIFIIPFLFQAKKISQKNALK